MNIEKIKNFNQKILALIGSLVVIFGVIGLIALVVTLIDDIFPIHRKTDSGLLAEEKIEKLKEENLRQQIVSYYLPVLVDTVNLIYYIPVSQKTLRNPEYIPEYESDRGLLNMYESKSKDEWYNYGETNNNLLIYDQKNNEVKKVFDERIFIGAIHTYYFEDDIILTCRGVTKDTDKDGIINLDDLNTLYIYSVTQKKLQKVFIANTDITAYKLIPGKKVLHIGFGLDRDGDGKFSSYSEPQVIKEYNIATNELRNIINKEMDISIQKLIEGS